MDRQTFSELVSTIYDAAIDWPSWPLALSRICDTFGFRKGTIDLNRVPGMINLLNAHHGIDGQQATTMVSHYRKMPEVWGGLAATMTRPIDRPWVVSRIMSQEALAQTAYYRDWVAPMGLVDGAALVLARDDNLFGSIRLATDAKRGIIDDGLVEALALLLPHCQRAARISGLLDASRDATRNFQTVIEVVSVPIVLVSAECAVVHANARGRAMLDEGVLLGSRYGRLVSPVPGLGQAIGGTIRQMSGDEAAVPGDGTGLPVRGADQVARSLHLMPLAHGKMRTRLAGDAVAAIFVSAGPTDRGLPQDVLRTIFGLTPAEIGTFDHILAGKTTRETAAILGVATSTVRTHVQRLFDKTETHNRADLVRLGQALLPPCALRQP